MKPAKQVRSRMPDPDQPQEVPSRPPDEEEQDATEPEEDPDQEAAERIAERSLSNKLGVFGSGRSG
jgi:hypothetical protein